MKKSIPFIIFLLLCFNVYIWADDVIVLKNGDIINAVVTEVSSDDIRYKKISNINGPTYSKKRTEILSIKYSNGEVEKFDFSENISPSHTSDIERIPIKALAAEDNSSELLRYASLPELNVKQKEKAAKEFFPIMAFTDSSIISTKDLTIMVKPQVVNYIIGITLYEEIKYVFCILNKTDRPIYVDRANCFRRYNDMTTKSYFDNTQITTTNGHTSGGGIGFVNGLFGIGGGSSSHYSYSETYGVDRFLVIAPHSKANLVDYKTIRASSKGPETKVVTDIEWWWFNLRSSDRVNQGEVKTYTKDTTPYSNRYYITYSVDENFNHAYFIEFELYAKYLVGAGLTSCEHTHSFFNPRIVKEYKKIIPNFWKNSCFAIIGREGWYL